MSKVIARSVTTYLSNVPLGTGTPLLRFKSPLPQSYQIFSNGFMHHNHNHKKSYHQDFSLYMSKPKSGSTVDSYQTVSVNCSKCKSRLFRYKKKNGTKSNLIKCYVERIVDDYFGLLNEEDNIGIDASSESNNNNNNNEWFCPNCNSRFARSATMHGRPALKLVGGKVRMTKK